MGTATMTILVATDGSPDARDAERVAASICRSTGAALHLVHAWEYTPIVYDAYAIPFGEEDYRAFEDAACSILSTSAARLASLGSAPVGRHLRRGNPSDEIVQVASEIGAELIVIGSRGLGPVKRIVLGSVSEGVVRESPCPVLVMRGGAAAWPPSRIVVGDDGSAIAMIALEFAMKLADATGAWLTTARALPVTLGGDEATLRDTESALRLRATWALEERHLEVQAVAAYEDPAGLLLRLVEDERTLIAIGSRGLRLVDRLRLGSNSLKALHAAHGPVLIVPRSHEAVASEAEQPDKATVAK